MPKLCEMYDRECIQCGECEICDLDSKKKCDSCGKCINIDADFRTMNVKKYIEENDKKK